MLAVIGIWTYPPPDIGKRTLRLHSEDMLNTPRQKPKRVKNPHRSLPNPERSDSKEPNKTREKKNKTEGSKTNV